MRRLLVILGTFVTWLALATMGFAHEVRPSVADLSAGGGQITLDIDLNMEAFVAGVDLDGLEDTNATPQAEAYDAARALDPDALAAQFAPVGARMAESIGLLLDDGTRLPLVLDSTNVGEVGDVETLRDSRAVFTALAPAGPIALRVAWPEGYGTLILRQIDVEGGFTGFLDGGVTSDPIAVTVTEPQGGWATFLSYIPVGFDHILPKGLDHILFVLGLFFLSLRPGPLLWQITAFTLAHTVTLALGALGHVSVPAGIVEPIIAASIVYVAVENILSPQMSRWRPLVIFVFGLLHGLGFASVLEAFGLPDGQFLPALVGFNIGVELGQLTVIAMAYLLVGYWFGHKSWYRSVIAIPASAVIGLIGVWWVIERVFL